MGVELGSHHLVPGAHPTASTAMSKHHDCFALIRNVQHALEAHGSWSASNRWHPNNDTPVTSAPGNMQTRETVRCMLPGPQSCQALLFEWTGGAGETTTHGHQAIWAEQRPASIPPAELQLLACSQKCFCEHMSTGHHSPTHSVGSGGTWAEAGSMPAPYMGIPCHLISMRIPRLQLLWSLVAQD